jgi:hypothetical protein
MSAPMIVIVMKIGKTKPAKRSVRRVRGQRR